MPQQSFLVLRYIYLAIRMLYGVLAVIGNSLTVLAVAMNSHLQTTSNLAIASLAVADLLSGIAVVSFLLPVHMVSDFIVYKPLCTIFTFLRGESVMGNGVFTCVISLERFIYIIFPLHYNNIVTVSRMKWLFILVWTTLMLHGIIQLSFHQLRENVDCLDMLSVLHPLVYRITVIIPLCLLLSITIASYIAVSVIAFKSANKVHIVGGGGVSQQNTQAKITKMLGMVLGIFLIGYAFLLMTGFILVGLDISSEQKEIIKLYSHFIFYINSWINPVIYGWKSKDIRKAFKDILKMRT